MINEVFVMKLMLNENFGSENFWFYKLVVGCYFVLGYVLCFSFFFVLVISFFKCFREFKNWYECYFRRSMLVSCEKIFMCCLFVKKERVLVLIDCLFDYEVNYNFCC